MSRRRRDVDPLLVEDVRARLARDGLVPGRVPASTVAAALQRAGPVSGAPPLGAGGVLAALDGVTAHLSGAGPLQPLLDEPGVTDVLVNGPAEVWVDRGDGLRRVDLSLGGEDDVRALACRLASAAGRRLDDASPCVDARLPDGVRLHAVLPPVSPAGTLLSLRVPRRRTFTLDELSDVGTVPPTWVGLLRAVVEARLSFLVSGGTGCGKTTVLSTLLSLAAPGERLVLVEDSGELAPSHPHVIRLEARHGNAEGVGGVGLDELVRQALRMRPDRIVVGECRGAEVRELLAALNTGHEGGCGTLHANSAADALNRLETMALMSGIEIPLMALRAQVASAIDV
ncbi:MAG: TadA family conjugal transfer-associated ATPase, partial [Actinomycetes bacterium]